VTVEHVAVTAHSRDDRYEVVAHLSKVGGHPYLDDTEVHRR
jgi:hypothetical protein